VKKHRIKRMITVTGILCLCLILIATVAVLVVNARVKAVGAAHLLSAMKAAALDDVDCIVVLGCHVFEEGSLSHMLRDRLLRGVELYHAGAAPKLLMSGDHGQQDYNEVGAMKQFAIQNGVPSEAVFMDHAGFSTYETIYRAKEIFKAERILIVTQEYHLYRALYIAKQFGVEAYGVSADLNTYAGQAVRDAREVLARCKDALFCVFKPEPTFLGEAIPVSGNGDSTND